LFEKPSLGFKKPFLEYRFGNKEGSLDSKSLLLESPFATRKGYWDLMSLPWVLRSLVLESPSSPSKDFLVFQGTTFLGFQKALFRELCAPRRALQIRAFIGFQ
jgi:hypothetical protein